MVKRIFVAGHRGMVGAALIRQLKLNPNNQLITQTHAELDEMIKEMMASDLSTAKKGPLTIAGRLRSQSGPGVTRERSYASLIKRSPLIKKSSLLHFLKPHLYH